MPTFYGRSNPQDYRPSFTNIAGARTLVGVPMLKEDELVGAISIYRQEARPFTDKQIALLTNFAGQAVIAIENARLLNELRQRTDDLASLSSRPRPPTCSRSISRSTFDLQTVLDTLVATAARLCDADTAHLLRAEGGAAFCAATYGFCRAVHSS